MKSSCEFIKKDQQRCKHPVAVGQHFCWQHARGFVSKWKSLPTVVKGIVWCITFLGSLASIYEFWPHTNHPGVNIQTSGDNSPVVQDNKGSVEINNSQSSQPKKESKDSQKPNMAEGNK